MDMNKQPSNVISFDVGRVLPKEIITDDVTVVDSPYKSNSWRYFESSDKGAFAGIWEAEPHLERCICNYDELCHVLEGEVRLTDDAGISQIFGPGDTFVVADGFKGTWENLTFVKKVFFILP